MKHVLQSSPFIMPLLVFSLIGILGVAFHAKEAGRNYLTASISIFFAVTSFVLVMLAVRPEVLDVDRPYWNNVIVLFLMMTFLSIPLVTVFDDDPPSDETY